MRRQRIDLWTEREIRVLREKYPEDDLDQIMIGLPDRTLTAIRCKASRLNIRRATPTLDIFLFIDRHPWINMIGPDGEKITLRKPEYQSMEETTRARAV